VGASTPTTTNLFLTGSLASDDYRTRNNAHQLRTVRPGIIDLWYTSPSSTFSTNEGGKKVLKRTLFLTAVFALSLALLEDHPALAEEKACGDDDKLISDTGLIHVWGTGSDSWWGIIEAGVSDALGTDNLDAIVAFLNGVFGFGSGQALDLAAMIDYEQSAAAAFDQNGNGLICVANLRGVRANYDDPNFAKYYFSLWDDKLFKDSK
jgi:hypothetical protein